MAIIYSYPVTAAKMSDIMVVSDVSASGKPTKSISVSGIKEVIDVVDKITDINGQNGQTGDIKLSGSNTIDIDFNAGANSITFDTIGVVDGSGTAGKIPKWSDSNTLTDSVMLENNSNIGIGTANPQTLLHVQNGRIRVNGGGDNQIQLHRNPSTQSNYIEYYDTEANSQEAFVGYTSNNKDFKIYNSGASGTISLLTTSGTAMSTTVAGAIELYHTGSKKFETTTTGATLTGGLLVKGGGLSLTDGTNNVTISAPTINTSYDLKMPASIGTASQVLKLPSTIGASPYQLAWGDAGSGSGGVPGEPSNSIQFNSNDSFTGNAGLTFTGIANNVPTLTIGDASSDAAGVVEIQASDDGATLKIGGGSQANYTSIKGSPSDTESYDIILPPDGPAENNVILESTSTGVLSWISTPGGASYSAGSGLDLTGTVFSADLKANGGLIIESTELAVDLAASAITGFLGVADGGTGASLTGTIYTVLVGTSTNFLESTAVNTGIQLPVGISARRPSASSENVGIIRYNTSLAKFEGIVEDSVGSETYSWVSLDDSR